MESSGLKAFEASLRKRVRGEVSLDEVTLGVYATDASIYQIKPVALVVPLDEDDVRSAVQTAAEHSISVLPRGAGTSLNGQGVGPSMVIDFTKHMKNILDVIIHKELIRQKAVKLGLDDNPSYQEKLRHLEAKVEAFKREELANLFWREINRKVAVSEEECIRNPDDRSLPGPCGPGQRPSQRIRAG